MTVPAYVPAGFEVPGQVEVVFETDTGHRGRGLMTRVGQRDFRYTFAKANQELTFHLQGGDARTEDYRLELVERPAIEQLTITVTPPAYTGQPAYDLPAERHLLRVLPGTQATAELTASKPLQQVRLMRGNQQLAQASGSQRHWRMPIPIEPPGVFHFILTDELGLTNNIRSGSPCSCSTIGRRRPS